MFTSSVRMWRSIALASSVIAAGMGAAPVEAADYVNDRFGYSIVYPANLLLALPESDNGDGRVFQARSGTTKILVYAGFSLPELHETPANIAASAEVDCPGHKASYRVVKSALVAISCVKGSEILYQKTILRADVIATMLATYPVAEKSKWDGVVSEMARSLTLGKSAF